MRRIVNVLVLAVSSLASFQLGCSTPPPLEPGDGGTGGAAGKGGAQNTGGKGGSVTTGTGGTTGTAGGRSDAGPAGAEAGATRSVDCTSTTEVTIGAFVRVGTAFDPGTDVLYTAPISSPMLGADMPDEMDLQFDQFDELMLNGGLTGGFNLVNDSVPETCSRCVKILVDGGATEFLAQSGILSVNGASPVDGTLDATLTNVTLSLVGGQSLGTGNVCLHVASATAKVTM
jgi:hypothetical protein